MNTLAEQWKTEGRQEGIQEGLQQKPQWIEHGKLENAQETLMDIVADLHGPLPNSLQAKIKSIQSIENLRALTMKAYKTSSLEEFTELVNRAVEN